MSDSTQDSLVDLVGRTNEAVAHSLEQNIEMQTTLVETVTGAFDQTVPRADVLEEGVEGYISAYNAWIDGMEELFETAVGAVEGEDVGPGELRDIWLKSTNDALSELMSTGAFAAVDDRFVETILAAQLELDEVTQDSLAQVGAATRKDVSETSERLVELERRHRAVEQKLDRLIEAVEENSRSTPEQSAVDD
jgi:hypothetical protein